MSVPKKESERELLYAFLKELYGSIFLFTLFFPAGVWIQDSTIEGKVYHFIAVVLFDLLTFGSCANPAINLALYVYGKLNLESTVVRIIAQLIAGVLAWPFMSIFIPTAVFQEVKGPELAKGITIAEGAWVEGLITFAFVLVVFYTVTYMTDVNYIRALCAVSLRLLIEFAGPKTGASINSMIGIAWGIYTQKNDWGYFFVYCVAPLIGALFAAVVWSLVVYVFLGEPGHKEDATFHLDNNAPASIPRNSPAKKVANTPIKTTSTTPAKAATPKTATPKTATPKNATPKTATPKNATKSASSTPKGSDNEAGVSGPTSSSSSSAKKSAQKPPAQQQQQQSATGTGTPKQAAAVATETEAETKAETVDEAPKTAVIKRAPRKSVAAAKVEEVDEPEPLKAAPAPKNRSSKAAASASSASSVEEVVAVEQAAPKKPAAKKAPAASRTTKKDAAPAAEVVEPSAERPVRNRRTVLGGAEEEAASSVTSSSLASRPKRSTAGKRKDE